MIYDLSDLSDQLRPSAILALLVVGELIGDILSLWQPIKFALHDQHKVSAEAVIRPEDGFGGRCKPGLFVR